MAKKSFSLIEIGRMMHELVCLFKKRFEEQTFEEVQITVEQFGLLHAISENKHDVIQKDIAEKMGKDKSAILRLTDSLESLDLVKRISDTKDRRKNYLVVTDTGRRVMDNYLKIVQETLSELHLGLTQNEINVFDKVVQHIKLKAAELKVCNDNT